jgi:hypothetical protein
MQAESPLWGVSGNATCFARGCLLSIRTIGLPNVQTSNDLTYIQIRAHRRRVLIGRRRSVVEGSFADSANHHGYKRARWRGRLFVSIQNLLIGAVPILRKLIHANGYPKRRFTANRAQFVAYFRIMSKEILLMVPLRRSILLPK